ASLSSSSDPGDLGGGGGVGEAGSGVGVREGEASRLAMASNLSAGSAVLASFSSLDLPHHPTPGTYDTTTCGLFGSLVSIDIRRIIPASLPTISSSPNGLLYPQRLPPSSSSASSSS